MGLSHPGTSGIQSSFGFLSSFPLSKASSQFLCHGWLLEVSEIAGFHPVEDATALTDSERLQGKPAASPPTLFRRDSFLGPTG